MSHFVVRRRRIVRFGLVALAALVVGCASRPWSRDGAQIPAGELLAGTVLGTPHQPGMQAEPESVLAVSPEMHHFLQSHVAGRDSGVRRLRQLAAALLDERSFGLQYDDVTRTAAETFRARRGNCLSFSNMFVAMARQVGLDAHFQEVDTPPDWSVSQDAYVLNRHVNVVVTLGAEGEHLVDFNMDDFRTSYDRRAIPDSRALAHHYNNVAVERMQQSDPASALAFFRRAVELDPDFSPAWTNLGTLYLREHHPAHADAAYQRALQADDRDLVALSNLASLYDQRGDRDLAKRYRRRVAKHRSRNPYYRLERARQAFRARDYATAVEHLEYAISRKDNEDQFYFLLGLCHAEMGDEAAARGWFARAEAVAGSDAMKRRYASKIEGLLTGSAAATGEGD